MRRAAAVGAALLAVITAGCTASSHTAPTNTTTRTVVQTQTRPPSSGSFTPAPAASVHPLPPGHRPRAGEREARCPYIKSGLDEDNGRGTNLADLEGDRVYRTTLLTDLHPVGCRFYFYSGPFEAVADIRPQTFATPSAARDAMILTGRAGGELSVVRDFADGLTGISFRTRYFGPDGRQDWAFVFAKGRVLVGVYTQRKDTSYNAVLIAKAVASKF